MTTIYQYFTDKLGAARRRHVAATADQQQHFQPSLWKRRRPLLGGSVGWVDPRPNWGEVNNFNKGVS